MSKLRYSDFWDRIDIDAFEEAIGFSPIDTDGRGNDVGHCIWPENHANGDTTGKFAIHREKRVYNCYVCGGGSLLSLAMELNDQDVDEATIWLRQFCGEDRRSDNDFVDDFLAAFEDTERRINTLPYFNERVLERHSSKLPERWLDERGIHSDIAAFYNLRYDDQMKRPAPKGRYEGDDDYFGPAVIFPHYWKERLVGWQCRWLEKDDVRPPWVPKYTMTTDFPKEDTLWGYDIALQSESPVIVVESVPSALFAISNGYAAVATFGSNINEAQLRLLRRFSNGVITAPDNDKPKNPEAVPAGIKWQNSLTKYLKRYIRVWNLPPFEGKPGADLGDIASYGNLANYMLDSYLSKAYEPGVDL